MRLSKKPGLIAIGIGLFTGSPGLAQDRGQELESLPALERQLEQFLGKRQGEPGGARQVIDRRLRLKKCPQVPVIEKRNTALALIRCEPLHWRISVILAKQHHSRQRPVRSQVVVKRGQPVLLVARKNGFMISRQMQADRAGGLGDIIPVRATRRSRPILTEIVGAGRVALPSR